MSLRRLNLLDWILVATATAAVLVVVYRYRTQGFLDWPDLGYMAIFISGYTRYRVTRKKNADNQSVIGEKKG